MNRIISGIGWRYRNTIEPYVDLYGSPYCWLKRKYLNLRAASNDAYVYVYASRRNIGDYISNLGIRRIFNRPGIEMFAAPGGVKELDGLLTEGKANHAKYKIIIGGGGLFQECFDPFWQTILRSKFPFAIFGVGMNVLDNHRTGKVNALRDVAQRAISIRVRDMLTYEALSSLRSNELSLGFCPSVNFTFPRYWRGDRREATVLLHVLHPPDLRAAKVDVTLIRSNLRKCAQQMGLCYTETNNISCDLHGIMDTYARARIIVTSRLHGAIIGFAMGIPVAAITLDKKIESFVNTHASSIRKCHFEIFYNTRSSMAALSDALEAHVPSTFAQLSMAAADNRLAAAHVDELFFRNYAI